MPNENEMKRREALCAAISLPPEVARVTEAFWRGENPALPPEVYAPGEWLKELAAHLAAAADAWETVYQPRNIAYTVYVDTMACFTRFIREHKAAYGTFAFDRGFWTTRQTSGQLFRLGCLEFEMVRFDGGADKTKEIVPGDPLLSVHIPSGAALTRKALLDSYAQAAAFFPAHFPEYEYKQIFCHTWLLSPKLRALAKEGGGIANFQRDYRLLWQEEDSDACVEWVFGKTYDRPERLPEKTSLQRAVKALMINGGHLGAAAGVI